MIYLFIGRFQPFHNGHLGVMKYYSNAFNSIIIGIGSSQIYNTKENPFSFEERKRMINESLQYENIKNYIIIPISDINNPPKWVDHVTSIVSNFDTVLARNLDTIKLFEEKGYKVERPARFGEKDCSGKVIRKRIASGERWRHLVPYAVADIIEEIGGIDRIKRLYME